MARCNATLFQGVHPIADGEAQQAVVGHDLPVACSPKPSLEGLVDSDLPDDQGDLFGQNAPSRQLLDVSGI